MAAGPIWTTCSLPLFVKQTARYFASLSRVYLEDSSMCIWSTMLSMSSVLILLLFLSISTVAVTQEAEHPASSCLGSITDPEITSH